MVECFISCGRIDKKLLLFIILYSVIDTLSILYKKYLSEPENVNNSVDFLTRIIGEILGGIIIPYIIKYKTNKTNYNKQIKIKKVIKEYYLLWIINLFAFIQIYY